MTKLLSRVILNLQDQIPSLLSPPTDPLVRRDAAEMDAVHTEIAIVIESAPDRCPRTTTSADYMGAPTTSPYPGLLDRLS